MGKQIFQGKVERLNLGSVFRALAALVVAANLAACAKQSFGSVPAGGPATGTNSATGSVNVNNGSGASGTINQGSNDTTTSGSSTTPGSGPGATAGGPGGTGSTGGSTTPSIVGTTLTYNGVAAKAYFTAPLCQRGTLCLGTFVLRQVLTAQLDFDWHTDDTIYQHPVTDGGAPFGAPNVDYVPTGGHMTFPAGQTREDVHIQDISPNNIAIRIGVTMVNCSYGGVAIDCAALFQ